MEIQYTQEKLNSDYSDLNIMINNMDKENQPIRPDDVKDLPMDMRSPPFDEQEHERYADVTFMLFRKNNFANYKTSLNLRASYCILFQVRLKVIVFGLLRYIQRDSQLGSNSLLSGLLSSPGGASLDLPISTSELERLAKSVQGIYYFLLALPVISSDHRYFHI